jgi:flagellar basal body rod protein FlgB
LHEWPSCILHFAGRRRFDGTIARADAHDFNIAVADTKHFKNRVYSSRTVDVFSGSINAARQKDRTGATMSRAKRHHHLGHDAPQAAVHCQSHSAGGEGNESG